MTNWHQLKTMIPLRMQMGILLAFRAAIDDDNGNVAGRTA